MNTATDTPQQNKKEKAQEDLAAFIAGIGRVEDSLNTSVDFIQPGMLREGGVTMFVGDPSAGKTTFVLKMLDAIANGRKFLGHQHEPRPCLYLDRDDNSVGDVIDRMKWLGVKDGGNLTYFGSNAPEMDVPMPGDLNAWVDMFPMRPVIVCDSFGHFLDSGDENSVKDVNRLWENIRKLRRYGCSFIFLHHLGKGAQARDFLRGSSAIRAGIDFGFRVENKTPGGIDANISKMKLTRMKRRNHSPFGNKKSELMVRIDEGGGFHAEITNEPEKKTEADESVLQTLFDANPEATQNDFVTLAQEHGATREPARKYWRKRTGMTKCAEGLLPNMKLTDIPEQERTTWQKR